MECGILAINVPCASSELHESRSRLIMRLLADGMDPHPQNLGALQESQEEPPYVRRRLLPGHAIRSQEDVLRRRGESSNDAFVEHAQGSKFRRKLRPDRNRSLLATLRVLSADDVFGSTARTRLTS